MSQRHQGSHPSSLVTGAIEMRPEGPSIPFTLQLLKLSRVFMQVGAEPPAEAVASEQNLHVTGIVKLQLAYTALKVLS